MANSIFSEKEVEYIKSQHIARIATASIASQEEEEGLYEPSIQVGVVPVGFDFDGEYFYVVGMNILKSTKYKNILKNNKVAFVIDDLKSVDPWDPRGIKVNGTMLV
jgi:pyridoxamine 5'-phosphate oxidase family protein